MGSADTRRLWIPNDARYMNQPSEILRVIRPPVGIRSFPMKSISVVTLCVVLGSWLSLYASFDVHEGMSSYEDAKKTCTWKPRAQGNGDCKAPAQECFVNVSSPEGEGYFHILRVGPFTSTGGYQQVHCTMPGHGGTAGSWLTGGVVSSIDPHTEESIEFPPLHDHHVVTWRFDTPAFLTEHRNDIAFIPELMTISASLYFPSGSADQQCKSGHGGLKCQFTGLPPGYGRKVYSSRFDTTHLIHIQDIREKNSLPLSHLVDIGSLYITVSKTDQDVVSVPMKPVFVSAMEVQDSSGASSFTYSFPKNTAALQFITYYFPWRTEFVGLRMHFHSWEGDEAWLVRGNQEDLGIEESIRRPTIHEANMPPKGSPLLMTLDELNERKASMENALKKSTAEVQEKSKHLKRIPRRYVNFTNQAEFNKKDPYIPQLLCRHFGQAEQVSREDIKAKQDRLEKVYVDKFGESVLNKRGLQNKRPQEPSDGAIEQKVKDAVQKDDKLYSPEMTFNVNTPEMQVRAMYDGVLPGQYYRDVYGEDHGSGHCSRMVAEPGEFITVVHFNVPRYVHVNKTHPSEKMFDATPLTMDSQHTVWNGFAHFPDLEQMK